MNPSLTGSNLTLAATGDSLITRPQRVYNEESFLALRALLQDSDVAFTNLETIFHTFSEGYPAAESGGIHLGSHPSLAEELRWLGFDLFAAATNHSMDWSVGGLFSTIDTLDRLGVTHAGIGRNLSEARSPAYLETARGRVALIAVTSTFTAGSNAGRQRHDVKGRPGVNPLRYETSYEVSPSALRSLKEISADLGFEAIKARRQAAGFPVSEDDSAFRFLNHKFFAGETTGTRTSPHVKDLEENLRQVEEAQRQADWVFVSLHAHEALINRDQPAEFIKPFARACINSGADGVLGHGPHLLRGIELYRSKPIFYSLGNFIFQNETISLLPTENYEKLEMDCEATPADVFDARTIDVHDELIGFAGDRRFWESVVAVSEFSERRLTKIMLHPITLGFGNPRSRRGRPQLARGLLAEEIIQRLRRLSAPFGTAIEMKNGLGIIKVN